MKTFIVSHLIRCVVVSAIAVVLIVPLSANADEYGFEKKDKLAEQARYLEKLKDDRTKAELAVKNTKALIHKARNKPYLPELYLRLAELYIEESRLVYYIRKTEKGEASSAFDQLEANTLKNQALEVYERILNDFPDFKSKDKVHFFMAHEYRELNQIDDMVKEYRTIIKDFPDSIYVPESYLLLGDYFISKQDLDTAKKHYEAILKYPNSAAISIARYKLGWCEINQLKFCEAIKLFEEVVKGVEKGKNIEIDTYKRVDIKQEALMDMAYCYTECNKDSSPEDALAYFQKNSWSRQVYTAVLEKLANRYYIKKKWSHAVVIYRRLSALEQEPVKLLEYARNTFECVQATGTYGKADQDVELIVKALKKEKFSIGVTDEQKEKDQADFEVYARNIVTYLHDDARKKDSIEDFKRSGDAYKTYLEFFDKSPVYDDMAENYAEALFSSRQYIKAGKQYEALSAKMEYGEQVREEKLYGAVISYYSAIRDKDKLNYFETAYARDGLKVTGNRYAKDFASSPKVPDVLFNVAWISYDAGDFDAAIREFTNYIRAYPNCKATKAAVHLVLDSYNLKEDYEGLIKFGNAITADASIPDTKLKNEVATIVKATESKIVSSLAVAAIDDWETGKSSLMDFASKSASTGMGEQALYTVVVSSKEKGDVKTLLTTGSSLIKDYPKSDKAASTLSLMIDTTVAMTQFRLMADYLESFSLRQPDHKATRDFLLQAGHIRKGLGQHGLSNKDYLMFLEYKGADPAVREEVVFAAVENAAKMNDRKAAITILDAQRERLTDAGKIRSDAQMAVLYMESGDASSARKYSERAEKLSMKNDPGAERELQDDLARMYYEVTWSQSREYMALKLNGGLTDGVVPQKAKLLDSLEKGYQKVLRCKSPVWALKACYQSYVINREFARFLKEAPVPDDLTPEQQDQYRSIISTKAQAYLDKADQYLKTCVSQGHKWEICDPEVAGFFNPSQNPVNDPGRYPSFSKIAASAEIADQCLTDQELNFLHLKLMKNKADADTLVSLADAYLQRGDHAQVILIANKALDDCKGLTGSTKAKLNNHIGMSYLNAGDDSRAKDAFARAVSADPSHVAARANLAALLAHYGHRDQAKKIFEGLKDSKVLESTGEQIHPRAKEAYYATNKISQK